MIPIKDRYKILLFLLIASHFMIIIFNVAAFFMLIWKTPWYVALPINTFLFRIMVEPPNICPLTKWENRLRKKLDLNEINGFLKHYCWQVWNKEQ